ncbi:MAG: membrane fusion protein (multidrug efflux system) [Crocinitomix sp.]|jgi:membrane fusion protein (multidrug efflux system)
MNRTRIYLPIIGFSLAVLFSCGSNSDEGENTSSTPNEANDKVQSVEVVNPQERSFSGEILITGSAEANQKVMIYAMESGYVTSIKKDIGDVVKKGETIALLSNPNIVREREQKQAVYDGKKAIYDRLAATHEQTPAIVPLQLVDNAKAEFLLAQSELKAAEDRLGFLRIRAPFAGLITKRMVDNGALVQSGLTEDNPQGIVEIQEVNPIRVTIPMPESDVAFISKGMEASVSFPELEGSAYRASVSRLAGALDSQTKTMQVELDIENSDGKIKPGMYAKVLIEISSRNDVVSLPITAKLTGQNQAYVLVVVDNIVEKVPLRIGLTNKDYFEVLNPEITVNSLIIIQGKGLVKAGQFVNPVIKND